MSIFRETVTVRRLQAYSPAPVLLTDCHYRKRAGKWHPPPLFDREL